MTKYSFREISREMLNEIIPKSTCGINERYDYEQTQFPATSFVMIHSQKGLFSAEALITGHRLPSVLQLFLAAKPTP